MSGFTVFSTPTKTARLKGVNATAYDIYLTLEQDKHSLTLTGSDLSVSYNGEDTLIVFTLTQQQSARFCPYKQVRVMVNCMNGSTRIPSSIAVLDTFENLLTEVISDA